MKTVRRTIKWSLLIVAVLVNFVLGYWASQRQPPRVIVNSSVSPDSMKPGQEIRLTFDVVVTNVGCRGVIERRIVDSNGIVTVYEARRAVFDDLPIGTHKKVVSPTVRVLPLTIAAGPARTSADFQFYCNLLHELWPIRYRSPDVYFTII
jgi:hypothetical protein